MFSKALIFALLAVANCQPAYYGASSYVSGGIPVYRSSALYGGLYGANGWGYGANLGRIAGLGALRTSGAIIGGGALGYGTGALVAGAPAVATVAAAPAVATVAAAPALSVGSLGHLNVARGISVSQAGPVNAAVQTVSRTVDYRPVPYTSEAPVVQDIDVPPQESPLRINFQSKSSPLAVTQQHIPAEPGQVQVTQSEDEPQTAVHNVVRPVVQQVNEIVQPYRTLTQTVEPVIEQTHTNIAQGEGVRLTGLTSGVVGGTGVLAASGVGVAAPAVSTIAAAPAVAAPAAVGVVKPALAGAALYGGAYRTAYAAPGGVVGLGGVYGSRVHGTGLYGGLYRSASLGYGYGAGLGYGYGAGLGYGYGAGLHLNGLSGLSTYGTTAKIAKIAY